MTSATYCAIDFGTSNSAVAVPDGAAMRLVELEPGFRTMPTAVFYPGEGARAASAAAVRVRPRRDRRLRRRHRRPADALDEEHPRQLAGRADAPTSAAAAASRYIDVVAGYLRHLKQLRRGRGRRADRRARCSAGRSTSSTTTPGATPRRRRALEAPRAQRRLSRGRASSTSRSPPRSTTSRRSTREQIVLVADIGGGTSDFSLVRVGPRARGRARPQAPTSSPTTASTSPAPTSTGASSSRASCRCSATARYGPARAGAPAREVPSAVYFDLATWHLINTVYNPQRVAELRGMRVVLRRSGAASHA